MTNIETTKHISIKGYLDNIQVGSNQMPFTAWEHTERNKQRNRKSML